MIAEDRERFDWDHVLIDESQDWTDAERDLLVVTSRVRLPNCLSVDITVLMAEHVAESSDRRPRYFWNTGDDVGI